MNRKILIITAVFVVVAAGTVLFVLRGNISSRVYHNEGKALSEALSPKLADKYGEELKYTLDKFWSCYEDGIVSQNDMTDVVDRMRELRAGSEIKDLDVFYFIGYVSRIYVDGIKERHREQQLLEEGTGG